MEGDTAKTLKPKEKKKVEKRKKMEKLQKFLAESKMQVREPPKGSECHPTGALPLRAALVGESRAKFELLSQKASALDLDAVIARLVEKGDYKAEKAKRAADEYRKFLVLMGMGKTPLASKMVLDAWQAHVMPPALKTELVSSVGIARYTKMYEQDCATVFGHFLEHDPLNQQMDEGRLEQTKQQICDYFGRVDPLVWAKPSKASKPVALSQSTDIAEAAQATMEAWLDHINDKIQLRHELVTEDVHLMVLSQHLDRAVGQAGQTDVSVTTAAMESWMQSLNEPDPKEALLASDARLVLVAQNVLGDPIVYQGKAEVMNFFQGYEHAVGAREFLSVDGGAFMIEVSHGMPHPRMGILIFEVNPDGKIQNIKVWTGDLRDDTADLDDSGLTGVASLAQRAGTTEHTECRQSGSQPSLEQMRRFNASAEKVKALDMAAVVAVLVQRDGYSPTKAAELAEEYRKYLALVGTGLQPVPSKKVDDAWHAHILNTKNYAADTQALFGHFLHHEPANLLLNEQGLQEQKSSMDNMFVSTKMQICDFYGRVNEDAWAKEDVAL
ncbi:CBWD5, partial [Symbiodinium sp. CCMP2456]